MTARCAACRAAFAPTDPRQTFCPACRAALPSLETSQASQTSRTWAGTSSAHPAFRAPSDTRVDAGFPGAFSSQEKEREKEKIFLSAEVPSLAAARAEGRRVGNFTILEELGKGGMGVVYKAFDETLRRPVALKVTIDQGDMKERLRREAHAVSRLKHPNIVALHGLHELDGRLVLAMDFIEGVTLDVRVTRGLPLVKGIEILRDVARAVAHAHEQGVVHRDIKPKNIIIDPKDRPFVLDFGLARIDSEAGTAAGVTKTGATLGTPAYMPPEQADTAHGTVGKHSDVYSIGATLYHVLAKRPPFEGETEINVITALLTRDPAPPSEVNPRAAGDLDTICLKCLEKDPARRYGSAEEVAAELDRWLAGEPIVARPLSGVGRAARFVRRHAMTFGAGGAGLAIAVSAIVAAFVQPRLAARRQRLATEHAAQVVSATALSLREDALKKLGAARAKLEAKDALASLDEVSARLKDVAALREALRTAGKSVEPGVSDDDLGKAVDGALASFGREALLARAARDRGRAHALAGRRADAARERAAAYRLDPSGEDGAGAFLEIAFDLFDREDFSRAFGLFRTMASRRERLSPGIAALADLGAGRAALALGQNDIARSLLRRAANAQAALGPQGPVAKWFDTVATRLGGGVTLENLHARSVVSFKSSEDGPPELAVLTTTRLVLLRAVPAAPWLDEVASFPVANARTLQSLWLREGPHLALVVPEEKRELILILRREGERLVPRATIPLPEAFQASRLIAAGDLDQDGQDDLVVQTHPRPGVPPIVVVIAGIPDKVGVHGLPTIVPCNRDDGFNALIADVDGEPGNELLLASPGWAEFNLRIFPGRKPPWKASPEEIQRLCRGRTTSMFKDERGKRLVVAVDRESGLDGMFPPGEDHKEWPDAVWALVSGPGGLEFGASPLVERPFEDRDKSRLTLAAGTGFLKEHPDAFALTMIEGDDDHEKRRHLDVVRAGFPTVRIDQWLHLATDLDQDGHPDFVVDMTPFTVTGLAAPLAASKLTPIVEPAALDATPVDVGLDLLACGLPQEAAQELRAALAGPLPLVQRTRARLALARALALLKDHAGARVPLLEVAREDLRAANDACLLAAAQAEELRERSSSDESQAACRDAIRDLERLLSVESLSVDERREIGRRLVRLRALVFPDELFRIDLESLSQGKVPALEIASPLDVRRTDRGLRFRFVPPRAGHPALLPGIRDVEHAEPGLALPFQYSGSSFRMKTRLFVQGLDWGARLELRVVDARKHEVGFVIANSGGGNEYTYKRHVTLRQQQWNVEFDAEKELALELTFVPEDHRVLLAAEHAGKTWQASADVGANPLAPGPCFLRVDAILKEGTGALRYRFRGEDLGPLLGELLPQASFELVSLSVEGAPGTFAQAPPIDDEEHALGRASRLLVTGDTRALRALDVVATRASSDAVRRRAAFLAGLAAEGDDGVKRLSALRDQDPEGFAKLWGRSVAALTDAELARLQAVVGKDTGRARKAFVEGRFDEALVLGLDGVEAAIAWYAAGDFERALPRLEPHAGKPAIAALAGLAAYQLHRPERALELWETVPPNGLPVGVRERARKLAKR